MIKINLVPKEILDQDIQRQRALQATIAVGAFLIVVVGFSAMRWRKAGSLEALQVQKQKQMDALAAIAAEADQLEAQARSVRSRLDVIEKLLKGRPLYPYFMQDFPKTIPAAIWIQSMSTGAGKAGSQLDITVGATSQTTEAIGEWLLNLGKSGRFKEPIISGLTIVSLGDSPKTYTFSLKTSYSNPQL